MSELKNLECLGLTSMGSALKHTFDILNLNRMQTGIDTYGLGRCPFYLEPSVIIVITDGARFSSTSGVQEDVCMRISSVLKARKQKITYSGLATRLIFTQ